MDIVAIGALHLALTNRHMRPVECHCSLDGMTLTAQLQLRGCFQIGMSGLGVVYRMAGNARDIPQLMSAPLPEEAPPFRMTLQADGILAHSGPRRVLAE